MKRPSIRDQEKMVNDWNAKHPVGTKVILRHDDGSTREVITCSAARMVGGHSACIWFEGIAGCWGLTHCIAVASEISNPKSQIDK